MENEKKTKLPDEIQDFLDSYRTWYNNYQAEKDDTGGNPTTPPPPPPPEEPEP